MSIFTRVKYSTKITLFIAFEKFHERLFQVVLIAFIKANVYNRAEDVLGVKEKIDALEIRNDS